MYWNDILFICVVLKSHKNEGHINQLQWLKCGGINSPMGIHKCEHILELNTFHMQPDNFLIIKEFQEKFLHSLWWGTSDLMSTFTYIYL